MPARIMTSLLALLATALAAGTGVVVATAPATAATSYGTISITGAVRASYSVAGLCNYHATVLTSVTLRTQVANGTTLAIAGSTVPPPGPINLATTSAFNVEVQIASGVGAGGAGWRGTPGLLTWAQGASPWRLPPAPARWRRPWNRTAGAPSTNLSSSMLPGTVPDKLPRPPRPARSLCPPGPAPPPGSCPTCPPRTSAARPTRS